MSAIAAAVAVSSGAVGLMRSTTGMCPPYSYALPMLVDV
jgi:hypothetical protein